MCTARDLRIAGPADSARMAGIGEQHDQARVYSAAERLVYFIERHPGSVQVLRVGIVCDEVSLALLGNYAVSRDVTPSWSDSNGLQY